MKSAGIYLLAGIPLAEALIIGGCVYVVKSTVSLPNRTVVFIPVVILLALCVALNLWLTLSNKSRLKILFTKSSSKFKAPGNKKTILSSDPEHTVMLTDEIINPAIGILCQGIPGTPEEGTGRKAYVMTEEFLIGRDPAQCDFVIDSSAVGRTHARIRRIGNSFFIADLNSRNGTFLNQKRLKKTEETLLPEKCTIKFASSEFFFLMT